MTGCTVENTTGNLSDIERDDYQYAVEKYGEEFVFAYSYLEMFYLYADKELGEPDDYFGKGANAPYAYAKLKNPDIYYMYGEMSDPFTNYFGPEYFEQIYSQLTYSESMVGMGVELKVVDSTIVLEEVFPGSPAAEAGLQSEDVIVAVNGTEPKTLETFQKLCKGEKGDVVSITYSRDGKETTVKITLDEFSVPTVFVKMKDSIPVIRITEFTDTTIAPKHSTYTKTLSVGGKDEKMGFLGTYAEFHDALEATDGAKATVIDLRGNPGGSVDHCVAMAAELMGKNETVVINIETYPDEDYNQAIDTVKWITKDDGIGKGRYYVLMANDSSASCAEIMTAVIAKNLKSPMVGSQTYGKGIGQYYYQTPGNGIVGITAMQFFDKTMESYHKYGIMPDFTADTPEEELALAVKLAKEGTATRTEGYGTQSTGNFSKVLTKGTPSKNFQKGGAYKFKKL